MSAYCICVSMSIFHHILWGASPVKITDALLARMWNGDIALLHKLLRTCMTGTVTVSCIHVMISIAPWARGWMLVLDGECLPARIHELDQHDSIWNAITVWLHSIYIWLFNVSESDSEKKFINQFSDIFSKLKLEDLSMKIYEWI